MNRLPKLYLLLGSFLMLLLLFPAFASAQSPPITIQLLVEKASYMPPEPIKMQITAVNESGRDVITRKGFYDQDFHMMITFTDPDGMPVHSRYIQVGHEPGPPYRALEKDSAFVETFPNGGKKITVMDDAHAYYDLTKYGRYKAQVFASLETFSQAIQDPLTGDLISFLDDPGRQGFGLSSDTVSFEIVSLTQLAVLQPNGGEVVPSGSTYAIRWAASSDTLKFDLQYSMNNGGTWTTIASKVTGTSYNWTVPKPLKNKKNCLVKVIGYNASNVKVGEDTSDSTFTIEVIKLTSPDGQELWTAGTTHAITWRTNGTKRPVTKVKLLYTYNGGTNWILIYTILRDNPGTYSWKVPIATSASCKVKVVLRDKLGNTIGSDVSDEFFGIQP